MRPPGFENCIFKTMGLYSRAISTAHETFRRHNFQQHIQGNYP